MKRLALYRTSWALWSSSSVSHKVFRAFLTVGVSSGLVKIVVLLKELAIAWRFGIGDSLDIFFTAILIPGMVSTIVAGSMYAAFMPTYVQVTENEGPEAGRRLLNTVTLFSGFLLTLGAILASVFAPVLLPILATGFSAPKLDATLYVFYLFLPWVVISGLQALWSATLNSTERFALAAVAPIVTPLLILAALWLDQSLTPAGLAVATTAGALLEAVILYAAMWRRNLKVTFGWYGMDTRVRQVGNQLLPMAAGAMIMSSNVLVDQYFAATLPAGSVATLNYGSRLVYFILGFVTSAIGTAIFPYYSKLAAKADWRGLRSLLLQYLGLTAAVSIPLTAVIFLLSEPLVAIMYQRGAVTPEATQLITQVQRLFVLQTPFYVAAILCVRLVSALRHNSVLMIGAVGNLAVNIATDALLVRLMGVAGIAFATVFVYMFSFMYLFLFCLWFLRRKARLPLAATAA